MPVPCFLVHVHAREHVNFDSSQWKERSFSPFTLGKQTQFACVCNPIPTPQKPKVGLVLGRNQAKENAAQKLWKILIEKED